MRSVRPLLPSIVFLFLLVGSPVGAQDEPSDPGGEETARTSLALGFSSGPIVGLWRRVGTRTELGADVRVAAAASNLNDLRAWTVSVAPGVKRRLATFREAVAPYLFASVPLTYSRSTQTLMDRQSERPTWAVGAVVGLGLDLRPHPRITVGGHAGLRASFLRTTRESANQPDEELWFTTVESHSSGVRVQIYF